MKTWCNCAISRKMHMKNAKQKFACSFKELMDLEVHPWFHCCSMIRRRRPPGCVWVGFGAPSLIHSCFAGCGTDPWVIILITEIGTLDIYGARNSKACKALPFISQLPHLVTKGKMNFWSSSTIYDVTSASLVSSPLFIDRWRLIVLSLSCFSFFCQVSIILFSVILEFTHSFL